ncbi:MAG: endonuclease III domain-containing protein [Candidatus Omnitrophica bacterium]|nr:endonuclease III domain-containing protein [Candidatus Omnitrophota bacterium]
MNRLLLTIYKRLYTRLGPQKWWPASTPFEVSVGAILTQNTAWANVEKAVDNLRKKRLLSPKSLSKVQTARIAKLIKSSGYYNIKAERLKNFLTFINENFGGDFDKLIEAETGILRKGLLGIKGIGPETADSMLLYAANKPVFVIDAYTRRILLRHGIIKEDAAYDEIQRLFMSNLPRQPRLFNEFHALIVRACKEYCSKKRPKCRICPLNKIRKGRGMGEVC